jgi:hypothetical protein
VRFPRILRQFVKLSFRSINDLLAYDTVTRLGFRILDDDESAFCGRSCIEDDIFYRKATFKDSESPFPVKSFNSGTIGTDP